MPVALEEVGQESLDGASLGLRPGEKDVVGLVAALRPLAGAVRLRGRFPVRSRRPAVLRGLHAIDARRLQERWKWVVSLLNLRPFGPL